MSGCPAAVFDLHQLAPNQLSRNATGHPQRTGVQCWGAPWIRRKIKKKPRQTAGLRYERGVLD